MSRVARAGKALFSDLPLHLKPLLGAPAAAHDESVHGLRVDGRHLGPTSSSSAVMRTAIQVRLHRTQPLHPTTSKCMSREDVRRIVVQLGLGGIGTSGHFRTLSLQAPRFQPFRRLVYCSWAHFSAPWNSFDRTVDSVASEPWLPLQAVQAGEGGISLLSLLARTWQSSASRRHSMM